MSEGFAGFDDDFLTRGVLSRRLVAWLLDVILITLLMFVLWWLLLLFGFLTLGLGFGAMAALPGVPFCYHFFSLLGRRSATPGQRMMGLTVRRNDDLGPPSVIQAAISVILYFLTLATSGLLLVVALITTRRRTLHDLASGLVVVHVGAMQALTPPPGAWNMSRGTSAS